MTDYEDTVRHAIVFVYLIGAIIWIFVLYKIYQETKSKWYILIGLLPLVPAALIIYNMKSLTVDDEDIIIRPSTLSMGFILGYTLLDKMRSTVLAYPRLVSKLMLGAVVTSLFSVPEYYFGARYKSLTPHIKLIIQTLSASMFIMVILIYFTDSGGSVRDLKT